MTQLHRDLPRLDVSRERIKDAEIERLNKHIEVIQEQSQHYIGEAQASADHWQAIALQQMEKAFQWEQEYDKLFALLNPKCEQCGGTGIVYQAVYNGGHPFNKVLLCPERCGEQPASNLSGEEQLDRANAFIRSQLDKYPKS